MEERELKVQGPQPRPYASLPLRALLDHGSPSLPTPMHVHMCEYRFSLDLVFIFVCLIVRYEVNCRFRSVKRRWTRLSSRIEYQVKSWARVLRIL